MNQSVNHRITLLPSIRGEVIVVLYILEKPVTLIYYQ